MSCFLTWNSLAPLCWYSSWRCRPWRIQRWPQTAAPGHWWRWRSCWLSLTPWLRTPTRLGGKRSNECTMFDMADCKQKTRESKAEGNVVYCYLTESRSGPPQRNRGKEPGRWRSWGCFFQRNLVCGHRWVHQMFHSRPQLHLMYLRSGCGRMWDRIISHHFTVIINRMHRFSGLVKTIVSVHECQRGSEDITKENLHVFAVRKKKTKSKASYLQQLKVGEILVLMVDHLSDSALSLRQMCYARVTCHPALTLWQRQETWQNNVSKCLMGL